MAGHPQHLETVCRAISDPTRRAILDRLRRGDRTPNSLSDDFPISRPAVSRHLRVLRRAGLVEERRAGRERVYRLRARPLAELDRWIASYRTFWAARLHDLKSHVESTARGGPDA